MDHTNDPNPNGRWNTLELVKGVYGPDDCANDIAEIKFDKPVPIKVLFRLNLMHLLLYLKERLYSVKKNTLYGNIF